MTLSLFRFLLRYRRTYLGPFWLLVGPSLFIVLIGGLYAEIGAVNIEYFIPYMAIGLIVWNLISNFINGAATVFVRERASIVNGGLSTSRVAIIDVNTNIIIFAHQALIIFFIVIYFPVSLGYGSLFSLFGIFILIINGIFVTNYLGIIGARYRDLGEMLQAIMRIAFLATPIIWIPAGDFGSSFIRQYLLLNPFYHFIEIVRAPLLGDEIEVITWGVVITITLANFFIMQIVRSNFGRFVPLWV